MILLRILRQHLFLAIFFFLLLQIPIYNHNISFRDEGFLTLNALRINQGEIPYKDFFLTTTPGTFYIQAFLMKLFGNYLLIARIFYITVVIGILFIASRIFTLKSYSNYLFLFFLALLFVSPAYAFYNVEGLLLFLLSFYLLKKIQKNRTFYFFVLLGIISGSLFLIKQSYGVANVVAILFVLYRYRTRGKWLKNSFVYLITFGAVLLSYVLYLFFNNALSDFIYYVFSFSREVKGHRGPFILTATTFIPFYFVFLYFMKKLTVRQKIYICFSFVVISFVFYLLVSPARIERLFTIIHDPLVYYYLALLLVPLTVIHFFWKQKNIHAKEMVLLAVFSLCLFLASASSGRDCTTVLMVSAFFLPLGLSFIDSKKITSGKPWLILVMLIYTLPFIISKIPLFASTEAVDARSNIQALQGMALSQKERMELEDVIAYIRGHVSEKNTIICFPYCPLLPVLADRGSASFFSFYYPETFREPDQKRVIDDIKAHKPPIIVLQQKGNIEQEATFEDKRLKDLRKFIMSRYHLTKKTDNFLIYSKNHQ